MTTVGTASVDITGDFTKFREQLGSELAPGKFGKIGKAAGVAMGAALAGAGIAKAIYNIGSSFDDAYDTIRVGTGATGKALKGLKGDFKDVVKSVPTDFDSASTAIADLNTRLGLSGKPLRTLSKQFLELSRITGTDVGTNIKTVTRAFGDWDVKTKDQTATLDKFFRASQASGASVDELAQQVVQFGAPLRQVGFSLDEATAMFASFEKAGVNTQTMMPGLKMALKQFMKEGLEPGKALRDTFEGIKNGTVSTTDALKIFGSRAGPDMVEAIRQGRFELDWMTDALVNGSDTVMQAGKDTQDFSEKWQMFKNRVMVGLEPLAIRVFGALGTAMDKLPAIAERVTGAISQIRDMFSGSSAASEGMRARLDTVTGAFGSLLTAGQGVVEILGKAWEKFGDLFIEYATNIAETVLEVTAGITKALGGLVDFVAGVFTGDWSRAWDGIKRLFGGAWDAMLAIVTGAWRQIQVIAAAGIRMLEATIKGFASLLGDLGKWIVNRIADGITTITAALASVGGWIKNRVVDLIQATAGAYLDLGKWIVNRIADGITTVTAALASVGGWIKNRVMDGLTAVADGLTGAGRWVINRVADGITTVTETLAGVGGWIKNRVMDAFNTVKDGFMSIGRTAVGWIVDGLKGGANLLVGFVNKIIGVINKIPGVEIGKISGFRAGGVLDETTPGLAQGGTVHHDQFARGGEITRPMVVVGEEAPRHPEYVIPTNPAYRGRALALHSQLSKQLGVPGFALGGVIDSITSAPKGLLDGGSKWVLDQLPGTGSLPGWLKGTGEYLLKQAGTWIKNKVGSILGDGDAGIANLAGGLVKNLQQAMAIAVRAGLTITSTTGGKHETGSYHYQGRAFDASNGFGPTPEMMRYAKFMSVAARRSLAELFYTPLGYSIKHGAIVPPIAKAGHMNHVHVAMRKGGVLGGPTGLPFVGSYKSGGVVPRDGMAHVHAGEVITPADRANGVDVHVHFDDPTLKNLIHVEVLERDRETAGAYRAGVRS